MPIAYVSASTVVTGSTTLNTTAPASLATGDGVFLVVETKPNTANIGTPSGWRLVGSNSGGAGTNGVGTGPTKVSVLFREKTAAWSVMPAVSITNGNSSAAQAFRFTKDAALQWSMDNRNGTYNGATAGTAMNVITAAVPLAAGDWVLTAISNHDEGPNWGSQSYVSSGITYAAVTEFSDAIETTTGNDVGGAFWGAQITAGSGSVTVQQLATADAASTGAVVFVHLREVSQPRNIVRNNPALARSYNW